MKAVATIKSPSSDIDKRIDSLTAGALPYFNSIFKRLASANLQNADILCQFLAAEETERNIKLSTRLAHIKIICWLNRYLHYSNFEEITKNDVIEYLGSLRKTEEQDPSHKWIGTYNTRQMVLNKFFRWSYNQNEQDVKKWVTPPCMQGVRSLPRKEKSPYGPVSITFIFTAPRAQTCRPVS